MDRLVDCCVTENCAWVRPFFNCPILLSTLTWTVDLNRGTALLPFQKSAADPDAELDPDSCLALFQASGPRRFSLRQIDAVAFEP